MPRCCLEWATGASLELDAERCKSLCGQPGFTPAPLRHHYLKASEPLRAMIRTPAHIIACAAAALALSAPLGAQQQPGGFTLPQPTPTPTPAPAGPPDERSGVIIPPRAVPTPRIVPAPVLDPENETVTTPPTNPATIPQANPQPPAPGAGAPAAVTQAVPAPDTPSRSAPVDSAPTPGFTGLPEPSASAPDITPETPITANDVPPSNPLGKPVFAWPWAIGALVALVLAALFSLLRLRRRAHKVVPRLAPPPSSLPDMAGDPPTLHIVFEITSATRSVMMFTLQYRLTIANRTDRAIGDLSIAVQLACAQRGASNAPSPGAAQRHVTLDRIGPHQGRSIIGEVQLPLSAIAIVRQGSAALFIPLAHVTVESAGQSTLTRSFVIGAPSASGAGRLHPIRLDSPPGSIPGLRAQAVDVPTVSSTG